MPIRLALDYDGIPREWVEKDAKELIKKYPILGGRYRIEESGTPMCFHVIFPKSEIPTFEEALQIAKDSLCDRDWLRFCERYRCFALRTRSIKKINPRPPKKKEKNKPVEEITLPVLLILTPENGRELKRLIRLSESIRDQEWQYKIETPLASLQTQIVIGCRSLNQARRRIKWLKERGLQFKHKVIEKIPKLS